MITLGQCLAASLLAVSLLSTGCAPCAECPVGGDDTRPEDGWPADTSADTEPTDGAQETNVDDAMADEGDPGDPGELADLSEVDEEEPIDDCRRPTPSDWLRVMTFNIKSGQEGLGEVARTIREQQPDIVALQEVDVDTGRSGGIDQPHRLSQLTGMASLFRTSIEYDGGRYGLAVLSRWPIMTSERIQLTSTGEQRTLVIVDILAPDGQMLHVAVTHLGLDPAEREAQTAEIVAALAPFERVILMGDFNEEPGGPVHDALRVPFLDVWTLSGTGQGNTYPASSPTKRIDWIMVSPDLPSPTCAWVPFTSASDHLPVMVKLVDSR